MKHQTKGLVPDPLTGSLDPKAWWVTARSLVTPVVIQTIRRDPSGSVWIDRAPNLSSTETPRADQVDAEHQATDLVIGTAQ